MTNIDRQFFEDTFTAFKETKSPTFNRHVLKKTFIIKRIEN